MSTDKAARTIARFINRTNSDVRLFWEPYGHHFTIRPQKSAEIVSLDGSEGILDVDIGPQGIAVWGWNDSILDIYQDGNKMITDQGYIPYED